MVSSSKNLVLRKTHLKLQRQNGFRKVHGTTAALSFINAQIIRSRNQKKILREKFLTLNHELSERLLINSTISQPDERIQTRVQQYRRWR